MYGITLPAVSLIPQDDQVQQDIPTAVTARPIVCQLLSTLHQQAPSVSPGAICQSKHAWNMLISPEKKYGQHALFS